MLKKRIPIKFVLKFREIILILAKFFKKFMKIQSEIYRIFNRILRKRWEYFKDDLRKF